MATPTPLILNGATELVDVSTLKTHPRNPRRGNLDTIRESIRVNGFYGVLVAQRSTRRILAGNHRFLAARDEGHTSLPVVWVDVGDTEALRILAADNRTSDLGGYDDPLLASLLAGLSETTEGLLGTGYTSEDLSALLGDLGADDEQGDSNVSDLQFERAQEVKARWGVEEGQVWAAGRHRIMCGSSLDAAHLDALVGNVSVGMVYADPPYGISIVASNGFVGGGEAYDIPFGGRKRSETDGSGKAFGSRPNRTGTVGSSSIVKVNKYAAVVGDDTTDTAVHAYALLGERYPAPTTVHVWWGGNYYANHLPPSSCWLVWDKENTGNFADAELAWCSHKGAVRVFRHMWNGMLRASERGQRRVHPTQKPVALAAWCFERYAPEDRAVLDPFLGSGPSVVAAEESGRPLLGMELSPEYVALNLERLSDMGLEPRLASTRVSLTHGPTVEHTH